MRKNFEIKYDNIKKLKFYKEFAQKGDDEWIIAIPSDRLVKKAVELSQLIGVSAVDIIRNHEKYEKKLDLSKENSYVTHVRSYTIPFNNINYFHPII